MRRFTTMTLALLTLFGTGCVGVHHPAVEQTLYPCEPSPFLPAARNEVYLFMMNNSDVTELSGLLTLRDQLGQFGFPKVYYAQRPDSAWYTRELRRIHRDRPEAKLLLLSYGNSASKIATLAQEAIQFEIPIEAVIFIDPIGLNADLRSCWPLPTIQIRSHNWLGSPNLLTQQNYQLEGIGHLSAATSQQTFQIVFNLMNQAAAKLPNSVPLDLPQIGLQFKNPLPRGEAVIPFNQPPEWSFLNKRPDFPTLPLVPESRHFENCPGGCSPSPR